MRIIDQHLFDDSHLKNRKRFRSLIKHMRKDYSSITSLEVDGKCLTSSQDKAEVMNNQFFVPFFTNENANMEPHYPQIEDLIFFINQTVQSYCLSRDCPKTDVRRLKCRL